MGYGHVMPEALEDFSEIELRHILECVYFRLVAIQKYSVNQDRIREWESLYDKLLALFETKSK